MKDSQKGQWKGRAKSSFWTLLRSDDYLRKTMRVFIDMHPLSQRQICKELDMQPYRLSNYLNQRDRQMNDLQILRVCEMIGLNVELKITIDEDKFKGS